MQRKAWNGEGRDSEEDNCRDTDKYLGRETVLGKGRELRWYKRERTRKEIENTVRRNLRIGQCFIEAESETEEEIMPLGKRLLHRLGKT